MKLHPVSRAGLSFASRLVFVGLLAALGACGGGGGGASDTFLDASLSASQDKAGATGAGGGSSSGSSTPDGSGAAPAGEDAEAGGAPAAGEEAATGGGAGAGAGSSFVEPPSLPPPSPMTGSSTLRLRSAKGGSALPFSAGYAFRQGDIPQGQFITASATGLRGFQAVVRNRWRDGSVKFAVLSGRIDLAANTERTVTIGATTVDPGAGPLGLAELRSTGVSASISYGSYGTVNWSGADWDAPFLAPASGPEMSSWVYRKPIGADAHLVAWLEVRLYRSGAVEVVPWIENGYLLRPSPGERSGTATFSLNSSERFNAELTLYNHTRAVLASGETLSHWAGEDPQLTFRHHMGYLQLTGLVPAYRAVTSSASTVFNRVESSYTPLARHNFPTSMGTAGFHPSIGPLPEWDVVYLTSDGDPRAWRSVQVHGYAAGRYGIHFRDETTNRALRFSAYPKLVVGSGANISSSGASTINQYTPAATGGAPAGFASSHMPSIGFMAYLLTGRWYFMDEMQLLSATVFLKQSDTSRNGSGGRIGSSAGANTTRGTAWALRALAHAAAMTPDDDQPLKGEFTASVEHNIDWYSERYVAQPNNPLGLVQPYSDYTPGNGKLESAIWMEDFLTWAFGNMKSVQAYGAAYEARMDAFLAWKYRSIVGRLGENTAGQWSYRRAAVYTVPYAPSETLDWTNGTGPWYSNWGEAYAAAGLTYTAGNTLEGSHIEGTGLADSYWGNLQPAIAYAVEHNAPGALSAYQRMVGASNWQSAVQYVNTATPVWSVRPRNVEY